MTTSMETLGLESLLAPKRVEDFLRSDFQKRPCVVKGRDASVYAGLLSLHQIEQAIDKVASGEGACRLIGGEDPGARRNVEGNGELRDVLVAYGRGASINLSGLDYSCPPVGELRRQLVSDFAAHGVVLTDHGESVVFITPANSQALKPHVDPDDLFVLQLEGRKRWNVYAWDPLWRDGNRQEPPPPAVEVELVPGDLLYVPQHWIHAASASGEFSFALTIGVRPASWATVLESIAVGHIFGLSPLFEALPPSALSGSRLTPQGQDRMIEILSEFIGTPVFRQALERFQLKAGQAVKPAAGGIAAVNQLRVVTGQTRCVLSGAAHVERLLDGVEIVTERGKVKGPFTIEPALHWLTEQMGEFTVAEMGGALSENAKTVLARRLLLEGVLELRTAA
jgi:ribosomal protein L16 Arg81 hydroxylase